MKNKILCVGVAFAVLACDYGYSQTSPAENAPVELPQFTVTARSADAYRPIQTQSVNRTAGSIMDSPFSVMVVTPELIRDLGANATFDVTRYFAGMSPGRGTGAGGIQDRQNFRGFESFSKTIDNFSSFLLPTASGFQGTFDPIFIDRVELVMGPNAVLSPTGAPGGSVNIITKSPQVQSHNELSAVIGNYNAQKVSLDSTGPIGDSKRLSYRVIAGYQDTDTFVPGSLKMASGSVQLAYDLSATTRIVAKYFGEQWGLYGTISATNSNGILVSTPQSVGGATLAETPPPGFRYNGINGNADWNARIDRFHIGQVELTSTIADVISVRFGAQVLVDRQYQLMAFPRNTPSVTIDPATGQTTAVAAIDPTSVPIVGQYHQAYNRQIQLQNDYAANVKLGSVDVHAVAGIATHTGKSRSYTLSNSTLPNADITADFYSPAIPAMNTYSFTANLPATASLVQAYTVMRAELLKNRLFVTGGGSRTWGKVNQYSLRGVNIPGVGQIGADPSSANYTSLFTFSNTGNTLAPSQPDEKDNYMAGLLFKPMANLSLYGSYSSNAGITANNPLWQSGKQYEYGVKAEFFDQRLQLSVARFDITQSNVSTQNPLFNTGQSSIPFLLTDQTSEGYEFNLVGGLTRNLSVIASYTDQKLRDPLNRRVRNIPDKMWNLLLNYRVRQGALKNLSGFVALSHVGSVAGETRSGVTAQGVPQQPGFFIDAWTVMNAGAGYEYGRFRFNLNIDNVLDDKFWWQPASRISVSPYPGRTVRLTTTVKF